MTERRTLSQFQCSMCSKMFRDKNAAKQHERAKHGLKPKRSKSREEPSYADRAVAAELDRAMGVRNSDIEWLLP